MYITVRRYEGVPNPRDAAAQVTESFIPVISQIRGFNGYYWVDAGNGTMISVSLFQDQAGAEESNKKAAEWVKQHPNVLPKSPQTTAGDVVGHKAK